VKVQEGENTFSSSLATFEIIKRKREIASEFVFHEYLCYISGISLDDVVIKYRDNAIIIQSP
jgi:hypothetical protein